MNCNLLSGKNNTVEDVLETNTGTAEVVLRLDVRYYDLYCQIGDIGQIVSFNNETSLKFWEDEACDSIKGSDGSVFPPFLSSSSKLHIFNRWEGLQTVGSYFQLQFLFVSPPAT